ncbi:MAG: YkgJ family cysteine cluster protein [Myxococcota bacterium]
MSAPTPEPEGQAEPAADARPAAEPSGPSGAHAATAELRGDVDDSLRFVHTMGMQTKRDLLETSAQLTALVEELVAMGALDLRALQARRDRALAREDARLARRPHVLIAENVDKYALTDLPVIDCQALLPICGARCCKLEPRLSFQDLDERVVRWSYARPYAIAQRADGDCVHCDPATRACQVYAQRPAQCRTYDCRGDKRIWLDFERRIPAPPEALQGATSGPETA